MKVQVKLFLLSLQFLLSVTFVCGQCSNDSFKELNNSTLWKLNFEDSGTTDWENKWFLDGLKAVVSNSENGMEFKAGPTIFDDSCHAVLWTKKSFKGDIKIEYDYTRTDKETKQVNIIYIQACGIGKNPYKKDIAQWSNLRTIPAMKTYFNNMNALHISYAAFGQQNNNINKDYIRIRKYPRKANQDFNKSTEISPAYFNTGLFKTDKTYKITIIKANNKLYFKVLGDNTSELFFWNLNESQSVQFGRVGLRHMYTRSARYHNFRIFTK